MNPSLVGSGYLQRKIENYAAQLDVLLERILAQEEEHANDMHDLLVTHEGRPMLEK